MKKVAVIYFLALLGCTNPKIIDNRTPIDSENGTVQRILEHADALTLNKSVIVFTGWFEKDTIKIVSGQKTVFSSIVETNPVTGLSTFKGVSNVEPLKIQFLSDKFFEIKLKKNQLELYKFVYISRDAWRRDKYSIEYSNQWKRFQ